MSDTNSTAGSDCSEAICSTHFTWSTEKKDACPECSGQTVLVIARAWEADSENESHSDIAGEWVEVAEEITGHWCPECRALRSLSFNS